MKSNGPQGKSESDAVKLQSLIVSRDFVAADAAAVKLFSQVKPRDIKDVRYIGMAEIHNLGTQDLDRIKVKKIKL
jgi:uncharacterized protein (DUF362 family)